MNKKIIYSIVFILFSYLYGQDIVKMVYNHYKGLDISENEQQIYDINDSLHNTTSTLSKNYTLAKSLYPTFKYHLKNDYGLDCLCMHHLMIDIIPFERICSIYNEDFKKVYILVNPVVRGGSKERITFQEKSVACLNIHSNPRMEHVFIEWGDPFKKKRLYKLFSFKEAACLQLALDEMEGDNRQCKN